MITVGSQRRETLEEAGYVIVARLEDKELILADKDGKREVWAANDDYAGYVIVVDNVGYEFVTSVLS
jgi:hypothetical protein